MAYNVDFTKDLFPDLYKKKYFKTMFKNPYWNDYNNSKYINAVSEYLSKQNSSSLDVPGKRSTLNRVLDAVSVLQYPIQGFLKGVVDEDIKQGIENAKLGFAAANPFGEGDEKHEYSFSDVLGSLGWQPENTSGKISRAVVGLAGDIFLDPTTYLTLGTGALIKGSGKVATKIPKVINMTEDVAKSIVEAQGVAKTAEEVASDAELLTKAYKKVTGQAVRNSDVSFGLKNAPITHRFAKQPAKTIIAASRLEKISDATFAKSYYKLRDNIYGTKFANLFSSNSKLYNLAKDKPDEFYKVIKKEAMTRSMTADKVAAERVFRDTVKEKFADLTPHDVTQIIQTLEDPSAFHVVKEISNFLDTKEAKQMRKLLVKEKKETEKLVEALRVKKDHITSLKKKSDSSLKAAKDIERALEKEHDMLLIEINHRRVADENRIRDLVDLNKQKLVDNQLAHERFLEEQYAKHQAEKAKKTFVDNVSSKLDADKTAREDIFKSFDEYLTSSRKNTIIKSSQALIRTSNNKTNIAELPLHLQNRFTKDGYLSFKSESDIKAFEKAYPDWQRVENIEPRVVDTDTGEVLKDEVKDTRFLPPVKKSDYDENALIHDTKEEFGITPNQEDIAKTKILSSDEKQILDVDKLVAADKGVVINKLSVYLYGKEGMISSQISDEQLKTLINFIPGHSHDEIMDFIARHEAIYSGKAKQMYNFIAKTLGYKDWYGYFNYGFKHLKQETSKYLDGEIKRVEEALKTYTPKENEKLRQDILNKQVNIMKLKRDVKEYREMNPTEISKSQTDKQIVELDKEIKSLKKKHKTFIDENKIKLQNATSDREVAILRSDLSQYSSKFIKEIDSKTNQLKKLKKERDSYSLLSIDQVNKMTENLDKTISKLENEVVNAELEFNKRVKTPEEFEALKKQLSSYHFQKTDTDLAVLRNKFDVNLQFVQYAPPHIQAIAKELIEKKWIREKMIAEMSTCDDMVAYMEKCDPALTKSLIDDIKDVLPEYHKAAEDLRTGFIRADSALPDKFPNQFDLLDNPFLVIHDFVAKKNGFIRQQSYDVTNGDAVKFLTKDNIEVSPKRVQFLMNHTQTEILPEMDLLLKNFFKRDYDKLSEGQRSLLFDLAEHNRLAKKDGEAVHGNIVTDRESYQRLIQSRKDYREKRKADLESKKNKGAKTAKSVVEEEKKLDVTPDTPSEEIVKASELTGEFALRQEQIMQNIETFGKKFETIANTYNKQYESASKGILKKLESAKEDIKKYTLQSKAFDDMLKDADTVKGVASIDAHIAKIKALDDAFDNSDAFETLIRSRYGQGYIDKAIKDAQPTRVGVVLDSSLDLSDKVKDICQFLRDEFYKFGEEEVGIGKLSKQQFDEMMNHYLPHILDENGADYVRRYGNNIDKIIPGFKEKYGYGRAYNPFAEERSIKMISDGAGGFIYNPNVIQINNFLAPYLKTKSLFSENIADIYLARALKHNELMYDHEYMQNMLEMFGKDFENTVEDGFKAVINFGKMKESTKNFARLTRDLHVSQAVSRFIKDNAVVRKAQLAADDYIKANYGKITDYDSFMAHKKFMNDDVERQIKEFIDKELPQEVQNNIFNNAVKSFSGNLLDDIATPMLEVDAKSANAYRSKLNGIYDAYKIHIKEGTFNLMRSMHYSANAEPMSSLASNSLRKMIDDMDMNQLRKFLEDEMKNVDDIDKVRFNRTIEKIDKINSMPDMQIKQVNDVIVNRANSARKLQIEKDNNRFLQLYDKFAHIIKLQQTTILPKFHLRNAYSNTFLNWLEIGADSVNPTLQKNAFLAMKNKGEVNAALQIKDASGKVINEMSWSEVYDLAKKYDVVDEGFFAKDVGVGVNSRGLLRKVPLLNKLPGKLDPTDTINFIPYRVGMKVGTVVEGKDRLLHFASQLSRGMSVEDAAESVNKFLFDYSDLTEFEKRFMKRIIPYYTFLRKNSALQLQTLIENPKKYYYIAKVMGAANSMVNPEDKMNNAFVNDFAVDWIQLPWNVTNPQGRKEPVLLNPGLPFMDLNRIPNPLQPVSTLTSLFTQSNPLIKTPIEQIANKNFFYDAPISDGKNNPVGSRLDNALNNFGWYDPLKGVVTKNGADLGLQFASDFSGVKFASYDYQAYKQMRIKEYLAEGKSFDEKMADVIYDTQDAIVKGVKNNFSRAGRFITDTLTSDMPLKADEYTGALKPISRATYNKLSDEDKLKYNPPTEKEAVAYNKQAMELSKQEFEKSGKVKNFIWSLFDTFDIGERNNEYVMGNVTKVVDGDTFDVDLGDGKTQRIRMLLIDTPETVKEGLPMQPVGKEASNYSKSHLIDKDVKIIFDGAKYDNTSSKRMLGYIEVDGVDYNKKLLEEGLAKISYAFEDGYDRLSDYEKTQQEAYNQQKGIWSIPGYTTPNVSSGFKKYLTDEEAKKYTNALKRKLNR